MALGIYDTAGTNLETARGPYTISLSLSPTGTFSGTSSGSTASGVLTLSSLRILTAGSFTMTAASTSVTSATKALTIVNYVYTITLSSTTTTPSVNFSFTITATLKGEDGNAFTGTCTVTLTESTSSLVGTTSNAITGGTGTFSVYLNSAGAKSIVATCPASGSSPAVTQTISITALTNILKITSFTAVILYLAC